MEALRRVMGLALAATPKIQGTWMLEKRVLTDGKEITSPDIVGMMTFTAKYRNFNIHWNQPDGQPVSISYVCEYSFTKDGYCERPLYWMQNNMGAPGMSYTAPASKTDCSKLTTSGMKTSFAISGEPVTMALEGDHMIATAESLFVDHWVRVK